VRKPISANDTGPSVVAKGLDRDASEKSMRESATLKLATRIGRPGSVFGGGAALGGKSLASTSEKFIDPSALIATRASNASSVISPRTHSLQIDESASKFTYNRRQPRKRVVVSASRIRKFSNVSDST
jgi:hypothetical protein